MITPTITIKNKLSREICIINEGERIHNCISYNTLTKETIVNGKVLIYDLKSINVDSTIGTSTHILPNSHIEFINP